MWYSRAPIQQVLKDHWLSTVLTVTILYICTFSYTSFSTLIRYCGGRCHAPEIPLTINLSGYYFFVTLGNFPSDSHAEKLIENTKQLLVYTLLKGLISYSQYKNCNKIAVVPLRKHIFVCIKDHEK